MVPICTRDADNASGCILLSDSLVPKSTFGIRSRESSGSSPYNCLSSSALELSRVLLSSKAVGSAEIMFVIISSHHKYDIYLL